MSGQVSQKNEYGIKLQGREDVWLNFSKYPKGPLDIPNVGDNVRLGVNQAENGKWWIGTCEIQHHGTQPLAYADGQVPAGGRDLSIVRQVCLKCAAELIAAMVTRGGYIDNVEEYELSRVSIDVLALAQDFERWVARNEVPFE